MEVYYNGEWGAVCDYGWDHQNANVLCRQLGFETAILTDFGQSPGADISLENVICSDSDKVLASCGHYGVGRKAYCRSHYKVAGVKCQGACIFFKFHISNICNMHCITLRCNNLTRNQTNYNCIYYAAHSNNKCVRITAYIDLYTHT